MTILQNNVIDSLSIENGKCVMTISDHLEWSDNQHMKLLEEKINFYYFAINSGEINEIEGFEQIDTFSIQLIYKYKPDTKAIDILEKISEILTNKVFF